MRALYKPLLVLSLCSPILVQADDDEAHFSSQINIEQQANADIAGASSKFEQKRTQVEVEQGFNLNDANSLTLGFGLEQIDITSDAKLPGSSADIPEKIKGVKLNLGWSHELKGGQEFNLSGSFGSVSDKPFQGTNALSQELEARLLIPTDAGNAWLIGMGYEDEEGLNEIPNVGFQWNKSETFQLLIGLPFVELTWQPHEQIEIMAMLADKNTELTSQFYLSEESSITLSHGQGGWTARRFGRSEKDAFMRYEEKRTSLSYNHHLGPSLISFTGGLITDRTLSENKSDSDTNSDLNIKDTHFFAINIGMEF